MRLLPFERETIVSPATVGEIINLLEEQTTLHAAIKKEAVFTGVVSKDSFTISLRVLKPQNFIPLVEGVVDQTSTGSIILLKFRFFPSTNFFLAFWGVLTFLLTLLFLGPAKNYLYGGISLLGCMLNYLIALANFDVHLKQTQKALHQVLDKLS